LLLFVQQTQVLVARVNCRHLVGISGSLRKASNNTGLLRFAKQVLPPSASFTILDISSLPLFNSDKEGDNTPESVKEFRTAVKNADGVLFACPENNYSVSAALKNALDWGSRGDNVWNGKPAAVMGTGGGAGTARAQLALRQIAVYINLQLLLKPEVYIKQFEAPKKFDENGDLIDKNTQDFVKNLVDGLVNWVKILKK